MGNGKGVLENLGLTVQDLGKILITGSTGFIGSHLTRRLVEKGYEVGIIKRKNSNIWRIKDLVKKITIYETDLQDTDAVLKVVSHFRPNVIFHLATYYAVEHKSEEIPLMVNTNVLGTVNLLQASKESMVKLFINTSSCFVYKQSKNKLTENDDLDPLNLYALTKIQAEQACTFYAEKYGLKVVTFRLFPPYGPADHERRLIPYVIKSFYQGKPLKLTTGKQRWDFVYVGDIVDAYLKLLNLSSLVEKHVIFNIGSGNAISVREIVSRIKEIIGSELEPEWGAIPHRKNEVWFICADTTKVKALLRWEPKVDILKDGLRLTIDWYKKIWKS